MSQHADVDRPTRVGASTGAGSPRAQPGADEAGDRRVASQETTLEDEIRLISAQAAAMIAGERQACSEEVAQIRHELASVREELHQSADRHTDMAQFMT